MRDLNYEQELLEEELRKELVRLVKKSNLGEKLSNLTRSSANSAEQLIVDCLMEEWYPTLSAAELQALFDSLDIMALAYP